MGLLITKVAKQKVVPTAQTVDKLMRVSTKLKKRVRLRKNAKVVN